MLLLLSTIIMVGLSISFCVLCWLLLIKLVSQPFTVVLFNAMQYTEHQHYNTAYNAVASFFFVDLFIFIAFVILFLLLHWQCFICICICMCVCVCVYVVLVFFFFCASSSPFSKCLTCHFALSKSKFQVFRTDSSKWSIDCKCYLRRKGIKFYSVFKCRTDKMLL